MKTFKFKDGTTKDIDETQLYNKTIRVGQPAKNPGDYTHNTNVYVTEAVHTATQLAQQYNPRGKPAGLDKTILDSVQVGVLYQKIDIGLLRGTYVPLIWNKFNNYFEIVVINLLNEHVFIHEGHADTALKNKVKVLTEADKDDTNEEGAAEKVAEPEEEVAAVT